MIAAPKHTAPQIPADAANVHGAVRSVNAREDIDALHKIVCAQHTQLRKQGGRATSPYIPFFVRTITRIRDARARGEKVSPTIAVLRGDGTQGVVDLDELFSTMGFCRKGDLS